MYLQGSDIAKKLFKGDRSAFHATFHPSKRDLNSFSLQITIPAQPGNPTSQPRQLTVQVPAHALQQSGQTAAILQNVLTQARNL